MENEELIQPEVVEETPAAPQEEETTAVAPTEEAEPQEEQEYTDEPVLEEPEEETPQRQRGRFRHALYFLVFLMSIALCALILVYCAMSPLKRWLTQYESVQPEYIESQIISLIFADPDWDLIYDLAGVESTTFEGKAEFISYMEAKTKGKTITYQRLPSSNVGDRYYELTADGELLATFTMTETSGTSLYADWTLGSVEVFFTREESITITTHPDCIVYINGVALDDSYIISTTHAAVEDILPDGLHADRTKTLYVDGLLCAPEIEVIDRSFTELDIYYTADADTFSTAIPTTESMTDAEKELIKNAAITHALFDVRGCTPSQLRKYFHPSSELYTQLIKGEPFCASYDSHKLNEKRIKITDFYRYSDNLFSAHVSLTMDVTTKDGETVKYSLDTTYFFVEKSSGTYLVNGSTDMDLMEQIQHVRLTYAHNNSVLLTQLVNTNTSDYPVPEFTEDVMAPSAWGVYGEDGNLIPVLQQQEDGTYKLVGDRITQPTTLYPIFPE